MNSKTKTKRPKGLDKRVYIPSDFPGFIYTEKYDLMYLILEPRHQSSRHKWSVTFDPVASGRKPVRFNAVETIKLTQLFESKPFDWRWRILNVSPSIILYNYLTLKDAVEVANSVAEYVYSLHNNPDRCVTDEQSRLEKHPFFERSLHIYKEKNSRYHLCFTPNLNVEILQFNNGRITTKGGNSYMGLRSGYTRETAIEEHNPSRESGILLINHDSKKAEFFPLSWNEFCLAIDRRILD